MILDTSIMWGLIIAGAVWLVSNATTRHHQPQIIQIIPAPDPGHAGGLGCLPVIIGLALLLLLLAGGK